jgi:hypothetical protein
MKDSAKRINERITAVRGDYLPKSLCSEHRFLGEKISFILKVI